MNATVAPPNVDVVGVGINATDTILRLPSFPAPDSKIELLSAEVTPGGQVASAIVACRRWGLRARYVGKIGDDAAGKFQVDEMQREGVDTRWITVPGCQSQTAYILVDEPSGERTVLWKRDRGIALRPQDLKREWIRGARALLVDGHDTEAAACAARWAHEDNIPVVGDFDNRYPSVEVLLQYVDFPITSKDFPERLTGEMDLLKSLPEIFRNFKCRLIGATLGRLGVLTWDGDRFLLCPGFLITPVDTTGAGDIFHGAFLYGLIRGWTLEETLQFSCAAAALNCEAQGARGGIAPIERIRNFRRDARRSEAAYPPDQLLEASRAAKREGAKL
ncbi:MAG TPA: PfkB family carbohydrate kinase [Candidatus Polarisedimenticolia bacterium]|nr:PfkB family carbohydrate kinase [Candidatus Polarisedimenticolia bacterium]